jgi:hypothetical protein
MRREGRECGDGQSQSPRPVPQRTRDKDGAAAPKNYPTSRKSGETWGTPTQNAGQPADEASAAP